MNILTPDNTAYTINDDSQGELYTVFDMTVNNDWDYVARVVDRVNKVVETYKTFTINGHTVHLPIDRAVIIATTDGDIDIITVEELDERYTVLLYNPYSNKHSIGRVSVISSKEGFEPTIVYHPNEMVMMPINSRANPSCLYVAKKITVNMVKKGVCLLDLSDLVQ